ncbi:MAG: hypothetical protein KAH32_08220, partial [Chlamydiia bacterium]|nr:hypothetical protein [Chlamydiia bacterium]
MDQTTTLEQQVQTILARYDSLMTKYRIEYLKSSSHKPAPDNHAYVLLYIAGNNGMGVNSVNKDYFAKGMKDFYYYNKETKSPMGMVVKPVYDFETGEMKLIFSFMELYRKLDSNGNILEASSLI